MNETDVKFLQESFKKYYFDNLNSIHVLNDSHQREFGYQSFNSGMIRHIQIKDDNELRIFLIQNNPADMYCSCSYYSFPTASLNNKDQHGADLIFDIDSKDLKLPCRIDHTCFVCSDCNHTSMDQTKCLKCNSNKITATSLTCMNCIAGAKKETEKLLHLLQNDLGIDDKNIKIYFSGNDGFHIHVYDDEYKKLGKEQRNDLVDYVMFRGFMPESFSFKKNNPKKSVFADPGTNNWSQRAAKYLFVSKKNKSKISSQLINDGYSLLQKKLDHMSQEIGVKIDANVTSDIHRIFRFPDSLNSKSGLVKTKCDNLSQFNPYKDACRLNDDITTIHVTCPISCKLKNKTFGPYKDQTVQVPRYLAVYLICKGIATKSE